MTIKPVKKAFTPWEFQVYCKDFAKIQRSWKPSGVVLHNTAIPNLAKVQSYLDKSQWTFPQLIDNWWVRYIKLGWPSGPHLFVMPDKIWLATPLDVRGTHSPSFNKDYWGIEVVGDFSTEVMSKEHRLTTLSAIKSLYSILGTKPTDKSFRFHGEDPRTSHKGCPGKNIHPKSGWIAELMNSYKEK